MMHSPSFKCQTSLTQHSTVLGPTLQQIPAWIYIQKHLPLPTSSAFLGFDVLSPLFTQPKLFQALTDSCRIQQKSRRAACHGSSGSQRSTLWHPRMPEPGAQGVSWLVTPCPQAPSSPRGQPLPACCCCRLLGTANPPSRGAR